MVEALILVAAWSLALGYVALVSKEAMQLTWIILVALLLASPVIALIWPAFR